MITGEAGKIYVDLHTNKTYRYGGTSSGFVVISETLATGEIAGTAYEGIKGAENRSRIVDLEADVNGIKLGGITVEKAADAAKLGGVAANLYAKLTDIPENEFFVVSCQLNNSIVSNFNHTFTEIQSALAEAKIPILFVYYPDDDYRTPYPFYFQFVDGGDILEFTRTSADGVIESITLGTSNDADYSSKTILSQVNDTGDTGAGAIVSKIEKSGSAINVTRRA